MGKWIFTITITLFLAQSASAQTVGQGYVDITADKQEYDAYDGIIVTQDDPYEDVNRGIFSFNTGVDEYVVQPVARSYRYVVPAWGRDRVGNAVGNLGEPVTFLNSVLQGDVNNAFTSFWRFVLNTTVGIGGMFDQAEIAGLEHRREDFGQTLGVHGSDGGAYVVIPFLGSSNSRDVVGLVVDSLTNPFNYLDNGATLAINATDVVASREAALDLTDEIERTSFDPYATYRSAYTQRRNALIENKGE